MTFNVTTPYTLEDGASMPIQIIGLDGRTIYETLAFLDPGGDGCYIKKDLAERLGLQVNETSETETWDGSEITVEAYEPCLIGVSDGKTVSTKPVILMEIPNKKLSHEIILGRTFLNHFKIVFDGQRGRATLWSKSVAT